MSDKINQLRLKNLAGVETSYDIDLPPDASPSISGLSLSGNLILNNEVSLQWKNTGGTAINVLKLNNSNQVVLGSENFNLVLAAYDTIRPISTKDNAISLGTSSYRWKDLYLGGTIRKDNASYGLSLPTMSSWTANKTIATTDQIPNTFTGTAATISVSGTPNGSVSLTANDSSATGRIQYIQDVTHTAATLTGTKTFNTDAIKAVTLSASETSTDGPTYVQSISGGSAVSPTTKYLSASFSGSSVTTSSISGTTDVASTSHTHSVTGTVSLGSNTTASGGVAYVSAATVPTVKTTANAASQDHVHTFSASGSASATEDAAVSAVTGYPNFSGGSASLSNTTRYLTASFSGTQATLNVDVSSVTAKYIKFTGTKTNALLTGVSIKTGGSGKITGTHTTTTGADARRVLTFSYTDPVLEETKGDYTPVGTIGAADSGDVQVITSLAGGLSVEYTPAGTVSLTASASSVSGAITYLQESSINFTAASLGTANTSSVAADSHTHSVSASGTTDATENNAVSAITALNAGSVTTKYFHPSFSNGSASATSSTAATVASSSHTHALTASGSVSLTVNDATATGRVTYVQSVSGGSAVSATTRYMKATTTAASTGTVGISGGSISKTTKYLSAGFSGSSTTSTGSYTPAGSISHT